MTRQGARRGGEKDQTKFVIGRGDAKFMSGRDNQKYKFECNSMEEGMNNMNMLNVS